MSWIDIMSRVCLCFIFLALRNFSCAHIYSEAFVFGREDTGIEHFAAVHITQTHIWTLEASLNESIYTGVEDAVAEMLPW